MSYEQSVALAPGSILQAGQYSIESTLGRGGFGVTYLAKDMRLHRKVAIKELFPPGCARIGTEVHLAGKYTQESWNNGVETFLNEAQCVAQVYHPGVITVYEYFEENNTAYMAMRYIQGHTLAERVGRDGPFSEADVRRYALYIADALREVHEQDILHRDIKPSNILLPNRGNPVLIDFGAAYRLVMKRAASVVVLGTRGFAAPEQYSDTLPYGPYTDIYGFAATIYYLLTGTVPTDPADLNDARLSKSMRSTLAHALAHHYEDRTQDMDTFIAELEGHSVPPAPSGYLSTKSWEPTLQEKRLTDVGPEAPYGDTEKLPRQGGPARSEAGAESPVQEAAPDDKPDGWHRPTEKLQQDKKALEKAGVKNNLRQALDRGDLEEALRIQREERAPTYYAHLNVAVAKYLAHLDPKNLEVYLEGPRLLARWTWPSEENVQLVAIAWRPDNWPSQPQEAGTTMHQVSREAYNRDGGYKKLVGQHDRLYVRVFSAMQQIGPRGQPVWIYSLGGDPTSRRLVRQPCVVTCNLTLPVGSPHNTLALWTADGSPLPDLIVIRKDGGSLPLGPRDGHLVAHVKDGTNKGVSYAHVALDLARWPRNTTLRVFTANPEDEAHVSIRNNQGGMKIVV
jgi:serine/threonine protein kinase